MCTIGWERSAVVGIGGRRGRGGRRRARKGSPGWCWRVSHYALLALLALVVASGCGGEQHGATYVEGEAEGGSSVSRVAAREIDTPRMAGEADADVTLGTGWEASATEWEAPSADVEMVFRDLAVSAGIPVFAPSELPVGTTPVGVSGGGSNDQFDVPDPTGGGAGGVRVILRNSGGWIQVFGDVRADVGDLPSRSETVARDIPGVVARLLGGTLVQWMWEGRLYAVYVQGLSEQEALRLAQGMVKLDAE